MAAPMSAGLTVSVDNFVVQEQYDVATDIANDIQQKKFTLLELVETLGKYLTSSEVYTRAKGTRLLSDTLSLLPADWLDENEAAVLVKFICDRIKDHHSITQHVLKGAAALIKSKAVSGTDIQQTVLTIFNEVHLQSLPQADRRHVYHMVEHLLTHRLQDVRSMNTDFVFGYIQCMDGERDPRNLVMAFNCVRAIATQLPLGTFAEDLFEVVSCYFPIDFTPPPDNPHGITRDQLILGLRACLASTVQFAEFCLPLLLEKLTSTVQGAKIDSFYTLAECADIYGEKLVEYTGSLWSCIRREVFSSSSETLEQAALEGLIALTSVLSKLVTPSGGASHLHTFVQDVIQDIERYLYDPDEKLVEPSSKALYAVASASPPACTLILTHVIPLLIKQVDSHKQVSDRRILLKELILFLKLVADWSDFGSNPCIPHKDELYSLFVSLLSHGSHTLRLLGVQGIMGLVPVPSMLSQQEVIDCSQHFLLLIFQNDMETRDAAIHGLNSLCAQLPPDGIQDIYTKLKERAVTENVLCLEVMARVCSCLEVMQHVVPYYIQSLDTLSQCQVSDDDTEKRLAAATIICAHLHTVIEKNLSTPGAIDYLHNQVVQRVLIMCVQASLCTDSVLCDIQVVQALAGCVQRIVCHLENSKAAMVLSTTLDVFVKSDVASLQESLPQDVDVSEFKPFDEGCPVSQSQLMCLFTAVVCSQPVTMVIPGTTDIMNNLLHLATRWKHQDSAMAAAKCLAGLVNKLTDDTSSPYAAKITEDLNSTPDIQQRAVVVLIWLTKALLMQSHPDQKKLVNHLLGLLSHPTLSLAAAEGFRIVLEDSTDILTPDMHAVIRFMYKQRMFVFTVDALISGFNTAQNGARLPYLIALSHLLKYVPLEAMGSHLNTLLPLVVQCLHYEGEDLWLSTLSTLCHMISESPVLIAKYLDELLTNLLKLTLYKPKMLIRIESLKCLSALTSLPVPVLVPHQSHVTKKLLPVLGDHKRLVRKEAVTTREKWFLVGAPGT